MMIVTAAFGANYKCTNLLSYLLYCVQSPRENSSSVEPRHLLFPRQSSLRSAAVVVVKKDRSGKFSPLQVRCVPL